MKNYHSVTQYSDKVIIWRGEKEKLALTSKINIYFNVLAITRPIASISVKGPLSSTVKMTYQQLYKIKPHIMQSENFLCYRPHT